MFNTPVCGIAIYAEVTLFLVENLAKNITSSVGQRNALVRERKQPWRLVISVTKHFFFNVYLSDKASILDICIYSFFSFLVFPLMFTSLKT